MFQSLRVFTNLASLSLGAAVGFCIGGIILVGMPAEPCVFVNNLFGASLQETLRFSQSSKIPFLTPYPDCMSKWGTLEWLIVVVIALIGWFIGDQIEHKIRDSTTIGGA